MHYAQQTVHPSAELYAQIMVDVTSTEVRRAIAICIDLYRTLVDTNRLRATHTACMPATDDCNTISHVYVGHVPPAPQDLHQQTYC